MNNEILTNRSIWLQRLGLLNTEAPDYGELAMSRAAPTSIEYWCKSEMCCQYIAPRARKGKIYQTRAVRGKVPTTINPMGYCVNCGAAAVAVRGA